MPKQTFFNLQPDKQKRILDASKKEFTKHSFYDASINQIIKDADISRGSFYQYFEDKKDLYSYLLKHCMSYILSEISKKVGDTDIDIFEIYIMLFNTVTSNELEEDFKPFIISTLSDINLKLVRELNQTFTENDLSCNMKSEFLDTLITHDNLKSTSKDFIDDIHQLLAFTTISQLRYYFSNVDTLEESRCNLINLMELIKHGVLK